MEHEPPRLALKIDDAFGPQQVLALRLNERIEPAGEQRCIHSAALADRYAADVRVVLVCAVGEQLRIKLQGIPEIEGAHAKHVFQINTAIPGRVDTRQRIERADEKTELLKLAIHYEIDLVDEHDIGEGDLLAGLLVVQLIAHMPRIDDRYDCVERGMTP